MLGLVGVVAACARAGAAVGDSAGQPVVYKELEGVVNCCEADAGVDCADGFVEVLCGWVIVALDECLVDFESGLGAADVVVCEDGSDALIRRIAPAIVVILVLAVVACVWVGGGVLRHRRILYGSFLGSDPQ